MCYKSQHNKVDYKIAFIADILKHYISYDESLLDFKLKPTPIAPPGFILVPFKNVIITKFNLVVERKYQK